MKKDKDITKVVFRKFQDGDVIALFPELKWGYLEVTSYMHIGQHGGADYNHIINITKLATESEYQSLKSELESIGYNLKVLKKTKIKY